MTSELVTQLRRHGEQHKGTALGGVLQWAALHSTDKREAPEVQPFLKWIEET